MSQDGDETDSEQSLVGRLKGRYVFRIGVVVLGVTIVLLAIGAFTFITTADSVQSDAETQLESAAEREAAGVEGFIAERGSDVQRLSDADPIWDGDDEQAIRDLLTDDHDRMPDEVLGIHYYDFNRGEVLVSSDSGMERPIDETDAPWGEVDMLAAVDSPDDFEVFEPYSFEGDDIIAIASPVQTRHSVVITVDAQLRGEVLEPPGEHGIVEVASAETGDVVYAHDGRFLEESFIWEDFSDIDGELGENSNWVGTISSDNDQLNDDYVVAVSEVPGEDWVVALGSPEDEAFDTADSVARNLLILIGFTLIGFIVVGAVISRDINSSLAEITGYAEEIENGNLEVDIDTAREDEFGDLSEQFDRIRGTLSEQIKEAESARKEAEVARSEAVDLSEYLQEQASDHSAVMQSVARGNLTERMDKGGREGSMDQIAEEFNDMMDELEKTIGQLDDYVEEVREAGEEVEQSAGTIQKASEHIAESIQKISDETQDFDETLERLASITDELTDDLEAADEASPDLSLDDEIAQIADIQEDLESLAATSNEMLGETQQIAGASEEQAAELAEVSERANGLQRYAQPLQDILDKFETEQSHEFVFSIGPTRSPSPPDVSSSAEDE